MNELTDPLTHIRAYAPAATETPSDELLSRAFAVTPRRPRRRLAVAGAVAAVVAAGLGSAAAAGADPVQIWNTVFSPDTPTTGQYRIDASTARKVFAVPGPGGDEFAAWTVENRAGWRCIATYFEPDGTTATPPTLLNGKSAHSCIQAVPPRPTLFGDGDNGDTTGDTDRLSFVWEAGDAVRAELQVSDGTTLPVTVDNGWLGGWYTREQVPLGTSATIVAYGSDGRVLGRFDALDQAGCDQPGGC